MLCPITLEPFEDPVRLILTIHVCPDCCVFYLVRLPASGGDSQWVQCHKHADAL